MKHIFAVLILAVCGCDTLGIGTNCNDKLVHAVRVNLVDQATNGPLASDNILVVFQDGVFADTVRLSQSSSNRDLVTLSHDRPGLYRIEVTAAGYKSWTREDVRVRETDDGCHVVPQTVTAELERL